MLRIDGVDICLAKVEGRKNCFSSVPFRLTKSRWVADYDVQSCRLCDSKFNQLRRKHHCRQCGDVFCNKCCKDKIILPQYNLMESERVCDSCKPIAVLVAQSISSQPSEQHIAALEINDMLQTSDGIRKAIQFGGMQAIVQLAMIDNIEIRKCLLSAIHTLATYPPLHEYMAITGAIKAVNSILKNTDKEYGSALYDGIGSLMIFCKAPNLKVQALEDGTLRSVLHLCEIDDGTALLAVRTLSLILEDQANHATVITGDDNALQKLLRLTTSSDEHMQEIALKCLSSLSMGSEWARHRIFQEDFSSGKCISKVLMQRPDNIQVMRNAVCLLANLACSQQDQACLIDYLAILTDLILDYGQCEDVEYQIARCIANTTRYENAAKALVKDLEKIIKYHLKSENEKISCQAERALCNLLSYCPDETIDYLARNGAAEFLKVIAKTPEILKSISSHLKMYARELDT
ncbi:Zinc finger FYVE domain-containing protein 21 [Trichoplax sp. H2]|nr:Zinc finger FYVE domain-containing protein 21 [Trichoplax sp. H2]|eukprot:RDD42612.1 Zinc finger FYVE domain-containing protein 21 [Trichoplax sp. H2]